MRRKKRTGAARVKKVNLASAEKAIRKIAIRHNTTPEVVRANIEAAIHAAIMSDDPEIQRAWQSIPCAGERPTPEEFVACQANQVLKT